MFAPASDIYSRGFGYNFYQPQALYPVNYQQHGYCDTLKKVRAIKSEMLAQARLERRLQELRRPRAILRPCSYDIAFDQDRLLDDWSDYPPDTLLEVLRLQMAEEGQIAQLEALRQRRRKLEVEGRLKTAAELRDWRLVQNLARYEEAKRLRELAIAEEEIKHLIQGQGLQKATNPLQSTVPSVHPHAYNPYHRPQDAPEVVVVELAETVPASATPPKEEGNLDSSPRSGDERRSVPSASLQTIEPINLLQRLSLLTNEGQSAKKKGEKQPAHQPVPSTYLPQPYASVRNPASVESIAKRDEEKPSSPPGASVLPSPEVTVKEQLERRLQGEYSNEVRDTILALLNSLSDTKFISGASRSSDLQTSISSDRRKAEAPEPDIEPVSSITVDVKNAMDRIREIESRFHVLENEFEFPKKLEFNSQVPTSAAPQLVLSSPITSKLAYTATNQPIRYYEQALSSLLMQLDSTESSGNAELRNKRKDVVRKVETALEDLEQRVEARWKTNKRHSVTIEDVTAPDEHLMTPEHAPVPLLSGNTQTVEDIPEPLALSGLSERPASVVEEPTVRGAPESTVLDFNYTAIDQLAPEQTQLIRDKLSDGVPVSGPAEEHSRVSESLTSTGFEVEHRITVPIVQPLLPPSDNIPLFPQPAKSKDSTDRLSSASLLERPLSPATIGSISHSNAASESPDFSETEVEGLLLENGVVEASHDIADESTSSEWSEVDGVVSRSN